MKISLAPNEILLNVVQVLNGHVSHLKTDLDVRTSCIKAIEDAKSLLGNEDRDLTLHHVRTRREKEKLKELADELMHSQDQYSGALKVRNTIPANQLPSPRRATTGEKAILKENFRLTQSSLEAQDPPKGTPTQQPHVLPPASLEAQNCPKGTSTQQPHILTQASLEAGKLATVPAFIRLTGIDGDITKDDDPCVELRDDKCLWDTGAQFCSITEDIVNKIDPTFLSLKLHDGYRIRANTGVQVDAMLSLSNSTFEISTIFFVLPVSDIPNQRSGVILGQHGFLNRIMVETIPRLILLKRGQEVGETVWGEIRVKAALDIWDELREFN